jgi:hypothetical protein
MADYILLPMIGLCVASMFTLVGARLVERAGWHLPLPLWFFVVSVSSPLAWFLLQAFVLGIILPDAHLRAGLVHNWPSYVRDVLFGIGLKLWVCGALCTAGLAFFRRRFNESPERDARAQHALWLAGGAVASAIILPMAMDYWIQNGRLSGPFASFTLACAFVIGVAPLTGISLGLLRMGGTRIHLRYAEPSAAFCGIIIVVCGYVWHHAVVTRPGAYAVIAVEICALVGVFVAWFAIRRGNRAAAAVLARSADNAPVI